MMSSVVKNIWAVWNNLYRLVRVVPCFLYFMNGPQAGKREWIAANPGATPEQYDAAMRAIAEQLGI